MPSCLTRGSAWRILSAMKALKALCWMFGIPMLVCGGLLTWFLVDQGVPGFRKLEVGDEALIEPGTCLAFSEQDLRDSELEIRMAYSDQLRYSEQDLHDAETEIRKVFKVDEPGKSKFWHIVHSGSVAVTILAISSDGRVAEVETQAKEPWRGFTFFDRLR